MDVRKRGNLAANKQANMSIDGMPQRRRGSMDIRRNDEPIQLRPQSLDPLPLPKKKIEKQPHTNKKVSHEPVKTVEIKIVLPALFSLSKAAELSKRPIRPAYHQVKKQVEKTSKKTRVVTAVLALIATASVVGYTQFYNDDAKIIADTQATGSAPPLQPGTPDYSTVLPASKSIDELGGWKRLSPSDKAPVYVYADAIGSTSISVSQQPLPDDFKSNTTEKVRLLAASFNANEKVTVGNTTVYIGKSSEGPQSVIFYKDDLLILMKSRGEIKNALWADYVKSLQ